MTYLVGDDSTITYPVTDAGDPPGDLSFTPLVQAHTSDGTTVVVAGAAWTGAAGATRDLVVPLASLPAGLWSLRLALDGTADLFLGNVVIE